MAKITPRLVVGIFGATRIGLGIAFAVAPDRTAGGSAAPAPTLMTRSFAVRELVLGVGGCLAAARATRSGVRAWAGLGALTDAGDLAAAVAAMKGNEPSAVVSAAVAALGCAAELWALRRASPTARHLR